MDLLWGRPKILCSVYFPLIAIKRQWLGPFNIVRGIAISLEPDTILQCRNFGIGERALSALMCGLRSPVPDSRVLGYIRARILVIVPLRVVAGPNKHDDSRDLAENSAACYGQARR